MQPNKGKQKHQCPATRHASTARHATPTPAAPTPVADDTADDDTADDTADGVELRRALDLLWAVRGGVDGRVGAHGACGSARAALVPDSRSFAGDVLELGQRAGGSRARLRYPRGEPDRRSCHDSTYFSDTAPIIKMGNGCVMCFCVEFIVS